MHQSRRYPIPIVLVAKNHPRCGRISKIAVPVSERPVVDLDLQAGLFREMHEMRTLVAELGVNVGYFTKARADFENV